MAIVTIFISLSGFALALLCLSSTPYRPAIPYAGALYFFIGSLCLIFYLFFMWNKKRPVENRTIENNLSKSGNDHNNIVDQESTSDKILKWLVSAFTSFISFCGLSLATLCIRPTPDRSAFPYAGALYFFVGALCLIFYLLFMWKKKKAMENRFIENRLLSHENDNMILVVRESLSDNILKWLTTAFALFYPFYGLVLTSLSIRSPDGTAQPQIGILFFFSGIVVLAVFVFVVWKNWATSKSMAIGK